MKSPAKLSKIARRWCKSIILMNEPSMTFMYTDLTHRETMYIEQICKEIANKITTLPLAGSAEELVKEYFDEKN